MKPSASFALTAALAATLAIPLAAPGLQRPQELPPVTVQQLHEETSPSIDFIFEHPGVPIPHYILNIASSGRGRYQGEELAAAAPPDPQPPPQPFDTTFTLTPTTTAKIFALTLRLQHFAVPCASHAKNIASSGTKTLRYTAPNSAPTACIYDYSENKDVQALTEILQAIAETMDQGRRLDFLHRYDRLGLDQAITALATQASAQQAVELTTIAPTLHSIADDPEVMHRVRTRATALLATIPTANASR